MSEFAATNKPGTCLWCGKVLRHRFDTKTEATDDKPRRCTGFTFRDGVDVRCQSRNISRDDRGNWRCEEYNHYVDRPRRIVSRTQWTTAPGYLQDNTFCTLTCGYKFGLRLAQLGNRLKLKEGE